MFTETNMVTSSSRKQFIDRITALNNKVTKARELLLNDDIEPADFRAIKMKADREITVLETKISDVRSNNMSVGEVEKTLDSVLLNLTSIHKIYCEIRSLRKAKTNWFDIP